MLTVDEAVERIAGAFAPLSAENVSIANAAGRVLAEDAVARADQPLAPVSAMDGYAVRQADAQVGAALAVIGTAPAGKPFSGMLGPGQAVRIFTGGVVPEGADAVVIQEDTEASGTTVVVKETPRPSENVRPKGLDFRTGDTLLKQGRRLSPRDVALLAAADFAEVGVRRKPDIAFAATGDELSLPGAPRRPGGVIASSTFALAAMVERWGGVPHDLGILSDRMEEFARLVPAAENADLLITQGGASVGDHDLVQKALAPYGFALDFWKIAMRPGKPLIFGALKRTPFFGLPGNPVSAMVCAILFLRPAMAAMLGETYSPQLLNARLTQPLKANGNRQDYIRTRIEWRDGEAWTTPFALQDSSMQKIFAEADGLIVRAVGASPAAERDLVRVLPLEI